MERVGACGASRREQTLCVSKKKHSYCHRKHANSKTSLTENAQEMNRIATYIRRFGNYLI